MTNDVFPHFGSTLRTVALPYPLFPAGTDTPEAAVCYRYNQPGQLTNVGQRFGVEATAKYAKHANRNQAGRNGNFLSASNGERM